MDDKIELNRRMNETLEAMARALFQSWFVDFDPVHAKAAVRREHPNWSNAQVSRVALPNLGPGIAELFLDSTNSSELGEIPDGWSIAAMETIATIIMGSSPPGDTYNDAGIGTPLVNGPVEFGDYFAIRKKWTTQPGRLSQPDDLIFCVRGSTTGRRVVSDGIYCLGRGVCAIRPRAGEWCFTHKLIDCVLDRMLSRVSGSVFPNLNGPDLKDFSVAVPRADIISRYQDSVESGQRRIAANVRECQALEALRDRLLPRLLSGDFTKDNSMADTDG